VVTVAGPAGRSVGSEGRGTRVPGAATVAALVELTRVVAWAATARVFVAPVVAWNATVWRNSPRLSDEVTARSSIDSSSKLTFRLWRCVLMAYLLRGRQAVAAGPNPSIALRGNIA